VVFFDGGFSEEVGFGGIRFTEGRHDEFLELARYSDEQWEDFRFEAELGIEQQSAAIQIGSDADESSRFRLTLDNDEMQATLEWLYRLDGEDELIGRFLVPFPVNRDNLSRLGLSVVDGKVEAWVETPFRWTRAVEAEDLEVWTGMIAVDDGIGITMDGKWYDLSEEGIEVRRQIDKNQVSEIRIWEESGERMMGLCFPARNEILYGRLGPRSAVGNLGWPVPSALSPTVGAGGGSGWANFTVPFLLMYPPMEAAYTCWMGATRASRFSVLTAPISPGGGVAAALRASSTLVS
jgi:hypothetical protein